MASIANMKDEEFCSYLQGKIMVQLRKEAKDEEEIFEEMATAQDWAKLPVFTKEELARDALDWGFVDASGFSDPSKLSFFSWMVPQIKKITKNMQIKMGTEIQAKDLADVVEIGKIMPFLIVIVAIAMAIDVESFTKITEIIKIAMMLMMVTIMAKMDKKMMKMVEILHEAKIWQRLMWQSSKKIEFSLVYKAGNANRLLMSIFDKMSVMEKRFMWTTADEDDTGRWVTNYLGENVMEKDMEYLKIGLQRIAQKWSWAKVRCGDVAKEEMEAAFDQLWKNGFSYAKDAVKAWIAKAKDLNQLKMMKDCEEALDRIQVLELSVPKVAEMA